MTGLLVSVRNVLEALDALAGGADLIDIKEPHHGALGAVEPATWREIQTAIAGRAPLSAALGELLDDAILTRAKQAHAFSYAKIGLADCASVPEWQLRWQAALNCLPLTVSPVAAAYVDFITASSPSPNAVLAAAVELDVRILLLDTFDKRAGNLLTHLPYEQLAALMDAARRHDVAVVFAGSLTQDTFAQLASLGPRYFAVRGAACVEGRTSAIDMRRVQELKQAIVKTCAELHRFPDEKIA